jgi:Cu+-exporting ATPase
MSGIIFFMLVGRFFQAKTHTNLQFDRDFRSFFPISVNKKTDGVEKSIPLANLSIKDRIIIRSQELIPADAILISGDARIDYSFVTGESKPEHIATGKVVYAGGRQTSGVLELEVVREVEQSHLTQLWNKENKKKIVSKMDNFVDRLGRRFGVFLILLSIDSFIFWYPTDPTRGIHALTTILIVACPCALLLSATFTHASIISLLGKNGAFVRQADVLEKTGLSKHIVWDKTGTITTKLEEAIQFNGAELNCEHLQMIMSLASQSNHPLSKAITSYLATRNVISLTAVSNFNEIPGGGIMASIGHTEIKIGSATFVNAEYVSTKETRVYISIDGKQIGYFSFGAGFRPRLKEVLNDLSNGGYHFSILSGDKSADKETLKEQFDSTTPMFFGQSPSEKLDYISALQSQGEEVIMVGDGLNDAGALLKSDVGIAISDDVNNFTPACDIIIEGKSFGNFHKLIRLIKASKKIVIASFILSLLYNVVGLGYAVRGELSPVLAAILMPLSTISIILFTTGVSRVWAMSLGLAIRRK